MPRKFSWLPTLTASFTPRYVTPAGLFEPSKSWRAFFQLEVPIFDGTLGPTKRARIAERETARLRLDANEAWDPAMALRIAGQLRDLPHQELNNMAWEVVKRPQADADHLKHALRQASSACRREPDSGAYLNTLGVAQYRVGQYDEALNTLRRSDALTRERASDGSPADAAFLAMTLHRLGRMDEAEAERSRLLELMKDPAHAGDEDNQAFLAEVEALFVK